MSSAPWVVKLGGSLAAGKALPAWLHRLAELAPIVVVPGGGGFADQVREQQRRWRFDDRTAHRMALLAMDQYGLMLCGLQPGLQACAGLPALRASLDRGRVAVWLPAAMLAEAPEIEASWDVTSDSLAGWLCSRLDGAGLVLVKSAPIAPAATLAELGAAGVVDAAFDRYRPADPARVWILGASEHARLAAMVRGS